MEENKELETVTESQRNAGKGLFLSGIIVGFAATLLVVGGIFIAFQIHRIVTVKDDVSAQVSYDEDSAVNAQTIKKLQLLEDTEHDHTHWLEQQLGLIDRIGLPNYLQSQIHAKD